MSTLRLEVNNMTTYHAAQLVRETRSISGDPAHSMSRVLGHGEARGAGLAVVLCLIDAWRRKRGQR